jgi:hypothetical protein
MKLVGNPLKRPTRGQDGMQGNAIKKKIQRTFIGWETTLLSTTYLTCQRIFIKTNITLARTLSK